MRKVWGRCNGAVVFCKKEDDGRDEGASTYVYMYIYHCTGYYSGVQLVRDDYYSRGGLSLADVFKLFEQQPNVVSSTSLKTGGLSVAWC